MLRTMIISSDSDSKMAPLMMVRQILAIAGGEIDQRARRPQGGSQQTLAVAILPQLPYNPAVARLDFGGCTCGGGTHAVC